MPRIVDRAAHFVLKKLGFFDRSYRERAYGTWFRIPIINGRKTYISEPWLAEIIATLFQLKEGGFIDVGVNLGQTMLKVAAVDPTREYVGFEPNPACADYAILLAAANNLPYVIVPAGVGSSTGVLQLHYYRSEHTDPSASLIANFRGKPLASQSVVVLSLSDIPAAVLPRKTSIIKIDVEGAELSVLQTLTPVLQEQRPFVVVEVLPAYSTANEERIRRQQEIEHLMKEERYSIFRIQYNNTKLLGTVQVDEIGIQNDLSMADYLLCPDEDVSSVSAAFA